MGNLKGVRIEHWSYAGIACVVCELLLAVGESSTGKGISEDPYAIDMYSSQMGFGSWLLRSFNDS